MTRTTAPDAPAELVKCACRSCQCRIMPGNGIMRDGKLFCSSTCAYDCTSATCVCIHQGCGGDAPEADQGKPV